MNVAQYKIVNLLKTFFFFAHQFLLVFVNLMCGPRHLFFFQCVPEMLKGWIPLLDYVRELAAHIYLEKFYLNIIQCLMDKRLVVLSNGQMGNCFRDSQDYPGFIDLLIRTHSTQHIVMIMVQVYCKDRARIHRQVIKR